MLRKVAHGSTLPILLSVWVLVYSKCGVLSCWEHATFIFLSCPAQWTFRLRRCPSCARLVPRFGAGKSLSALVPWEHRKKSWAELARTTVLSSAFFAQVQKRTRDTRLDNKAGDIMAKENFTLWTLEFNTVLRYFCVLLGDRRKGKAMVKTNPRTKLWFRARISYLSPMFMEKSPMFFGKTPTF